MGQQRRRPGYKYWFPAKKYGWGWGVPQTWQGWLVLDAYLLVIIISLFITMFGGPKNVKYGIAGFVLDTAALIWICSKKGEPPRKR